MRRSQKEIKQFFDVFYKSLGETQSVRKAYERAERWHVKKSGLRFYKNYTTFRRCQTYHNKK